MNIKLNIEYYPNNGEKLFVAINNNCDSDKVSELPMDYDGKSKWFTTIKYRGKAPLRYGYIVKNGNIILRKEWGEGRFIINSGKVTVNNYDKWRSSPKNSYAYTSPFKIIFNRQYCSNIRSEESLTFNLHAPMLPANLAIAVTGDFLNEKWSIKEALELKFKHYPIWEISVPLKNIPKNIEYKYILIDRESKGFISWEGGNNRNFITPPYKPREEINITDDVLICEFPDWRAAGVVIPLFSLRSNRSWGVGEISDLKLMAEWANNAGLRFVQLLPINDTTNMHSWHDSYPYSANSSFALNPLYLDVIKVGKLKTEDKMRKYLCEAQALNALLCIDYDKVITLKERYLRELYEESGYTDLKSDEFNLFAEDNKEWLIPYAAYSHLRDIYGTSNFENWGEYAIYNSVEISRLTAEDSPSYNEIGYYYFLQYHLHKQMIAVREYAHSIGIMFKGDIPIGVNRYSADVWQNPNLFDCNMQAGAPPDDFATDGQNWGFPTYRWDIMQKTRYEWWCARLQNMSQYFDAYRIDHVLGFFRIWSIPADTISGLLGYFVPALPLSSHEIKSAGFNFNPEKHTKPYITDSIINNTFDKYAIEIKDVFFATKGKTNYSVKEDYSSQLKAAKNIKNTGTKGATLINGIQTILTDVLFIEDKQKTGYYHPRIEASKSNSYKSLPKEQREAFDRIYKDFYFHRHNNFWKEMAMEKLPAIISATDMLVCGEDLGMIPASVPEVMEKLQILSLEVERMPKKPYIKIADVNSYQYLSVCTTSTHDMSGLRLWWINDHEVAQYYYNYILNHSGNAPEDPNPEICKEIIIRHFNSPSMLAILPLQDILASNKALRRRNPTEERINDPSDKDNNWCYRIHITIEELISNTEFTKDVKQLVIGAGRS